MGKCLGSSKEVLRLAEEVEFFNCLNTTETRSKHLNTKGKIYIRCCGSYGVLMLCIEFEGFTDTFYRSWFEEWVGA